MCDGHTELFNVTIKRYCTTKIVDKSSVEITFKHIGFTSDKTISTWFKPLNHLLVYYCKVLERITGTKNED